jgi:hypothetical protein
MRSPICKLVLGIVLLAITLLPGASNQSKAADASPALARNYEVRLRKLHLVRPDLISYPLMLEVYC